MMYIKQLYQQLTNFLNTKEEDRREVTTWYEGVHVKPSLDEDSQFLIQQQAKERILASIKSESKRLDVRRLYRWSAVAAIFLVGGYLMWTALMQQELATQEQLALIEPAKQRAIIVLENGQEIDLDRLALNESLQVGETIITKDAEGKVRYHHAADGTEKVQANSLRIPKAATYQLTLVDGTRVTLNSDSKLTYPSAFGTGDRVVQLEGEGYFEVKKTSNKSRFIVEARGQKIQVLGTKFNVKSYPEDKKEQTTLEEGSVEVSFASNTAVLKPNQQATSVGQHLETKIVDIDDVLSWTRGQFSFDGTNTAEVLQEIARWYDIDIVYEGKNSVGQYIGKIPRNLSLDRLIELLNYAELETKAFIGNNKKINLIIT
ncbi:FecR family protein [Sphingobacterium faecale]|uniref:FecR domain-containing protein n=1 Tax=Sphingobacterium faecale TaxID=2803775 RepID=A0ABS1R5D0_9SPHI|nr:FecR family protein [Sphingobacterium faecale]MBL1409449.1 FecR domain-containing protein [Sphingobacterium faecale]